MMNGLMRSACFSVAMMAVGCKSKLADQAEMAVVEFHRQFDAEDFDAIYDAAHPDFKKGSSKEEALGYIRTIRKELGRVEWASLKKREAHSSGTKTDVVLIYTTEFEDGDGSEKFIYRITDGKALLFGWRVDSSDLVLEMHEP